MTARFSMLLLAAAAADLEPACDFLLRIAAEGRSVWPDAATRTTAWIGSDGGMVSIASDGMTIKPRMRPAVRDHGRSLEDLPSSRIPSSVLPCSPGRELCRLRSSSPEPPCSRSSFLALSLALSPNARCNGATDHDNGYGAPAILAAMRAASGGDHWADVKSLHLKLATEAGGQVASGERWEDVAIGRYVEREAWPTHLDINGFDGIKLWHRGRSGIAYALGDVDAALVAADEAFRVARAWWFPDRRLATIAFAGTRAQDGHDYDVLDVTPEGGRPFQAWVDRATHLLARTDEQQAEDRVVTNYADYRSVHGMMLPFTIRVGDGEDPSFDQVETVRSVEVNPDVANPTFALPARPPSDVAFPPGRDAVEVPFRLTVDNRILVPLTINGCRKVDAEFDSGGSLILQPAMLSGLGINAHGSEKQGGGGEGSVTASTGRIAEIAFGGASVHDIGFHSRALDPDHPHRAVVGLEVLQRFVVRFDFDRLVMTLTRPGAFAYAGAGAIIPFHFQDNQPEVRGSIDGIAGLFAIDTGDAGSLLLIAPFARRYGLVARYRADLPYDGKGDHRHTRCIRAPTRGDRRFRRAGRAAVADAHDPVTRISVQHSGFDANRDVSANIGLGILKRFNVTFDYDRQRIILERNHLYGDRDVFNRAGLRLQREGVAWRITAIYPSTPAAEAGLHSGDVVTRINGRTAETLDAEMLVTKLEGPFGTKLDLRARSATGTELNLVLTLRDLL